MAKDFAKISPKSVHIEKKSMKIYRHAHKFYFIKNASALPRRRENQTKGKAGPAEGWALKVGCHQRADQAEYTAAQKQR